MHDAWTLNCGDMRIKGKQKRGLHINGEMGPSYAAMFWWNIAALVECFKGYMLWGFAAWFTGPSRTTQLGRGCVPSCYPRASTLSTNVLLGLYLC